MAAIASDGRRSRSSARAGCPRPSTCATGPDAGLPAGFRAAGVACGIKPSGKPDLGLLVCDAERPVSAARFTATGTPAAPVLVSRERCQPGRAARRARQLRLRERRDRQARARRRRQDAGRGRDRRSASSPSEVALASTGGISQLPARRRRSLQGILAARGQLRREGDADFQQAIQTTDAFEKRANLEVELPSGTVRLSAQCKGAGMISPRFATMLCFVQTDAALAPETADLLLGVCVKRSFDRSTVDGQLSTNDTAILMCSGASGVRVEPESEDELRFGEALDALLRQLAIMMVADGEGARRIARVVVRGGRRRRRRGGRARGRQLAAGQDRAARRRPQLGPDRPGGRRGAAAAPPPLALDIAIEGIQVCCGRRRDRLRRGALARARRSARRSSTRSTLPGEGAETEVFFSDLSHEYVTINAEYTT